MALMDTDTEIIIGMPEFIFKVTKLQWPSR